MTATRQDYKAKLNTIRTGQRLRSFTNDTVMIGGMCAQFVRQSNEDILNLAPGTWQVANLALEFMRASGRSVRYATDYEKAARKLGLNYPEGTKPQSGDIGYWPYRGRNGENYGHTAIFFDYIDGVGYWLENTDAVSRKGGTRIFKDGQVWLTPDYVLGTPSTLAKPEKGAFAATPAPVADKTGSQKINTDALKGVTLYVIKNGIEEEIGKAEKVTISDKKLFVKIKNEES